MCDESFKYLQFAHNKIILHVYMGICGITISTWVIHTILLMILGILLHRSQTFGYTLFQSLKTTRYIVFKRSIW